MYHWHKSKHVENSRELKIHVVLEKLVLKRAFYQARSLARSDPYVKQSHSWNELWVCLCHSSHRSIHDVVRRTTTILAGHDHVSCAGRVSGNDSLKTAEELLFQPIKMAAFDVDRLVESALVPVWWSLESTQLWKEELQTALTAFLPQKDVARATSHASLHQIACRGTFICVRWRCPLK